MTCTQQKFLLWKTTDESVVDNSRNAVGVGTAKLINTAYFGGEWYSWTVNVTVVEKSDELQSEAYKNFDYGSSAVLPISAARDAFVADQLFQAEIDQIKSDIESYEKALENYKTYIKEFLKKNKGDMFANEIYNLEHNDAEFEYEYQVIINVRAIANLLKAK